MQEQVPHPETKPQINQYSLGSKLGSGLYTIVRVGRDPTTNKSYAIKLLRESGEQLIGANFLRHEAEVLKNLDHPNIVKVEEFHLQGILKTSEGFSSKVAFSAMQLAENGLLVDYLIKTGSFDEDLAQFYFSEILSALDHCHSRGYAHRNLKPESLLLSSDFSILLSEFNISALIMDKDGSHKLRLLSGSQNYMAPELHTKSPHLGISVDVFGLGVLLFIMVAGKPPFARAAQSDAYYNLICTNNHSRFWKAHTKSRPDKSFTDDLVHLINALLAVDPTQRPSIAEIKSHPWFKKKVLTKEEVVAAMRGRKSKLDSVKEEEKALAVKRKRVARLRRRRQGGKLNYGYEGVAPIFRSAQHPPTIHWDSPLVEDIEFDLDLKSYTSAFPNEDHYSFLEPKELFIAALLAADQIGEGVTYKSDQAAVSIY